jgi:predicted ATPase with chaperone activity
MKAVGGVCIIDDFGRQRVQPCELLNRWIIPLERGVDYLTIHTGRKFDVPFDEMVVFSTNIPPLRLMDTAQLRRIKYKIRVEPPSMVDFALIFRRTCKKHGIELPDTVLQYLLEHFYPESGISFAGFHPSFFVEHAIAACRYRGVAPHLTLELVKHALQDLFVSEESEQDLASPQLALVQNRVS